ncbi:MAG: hypothetical protein JWQ23_691 [Herminiimonas sp.]|nr:hypothetical protein [Herminiimonas sp.]
MPWPLKVGLISVALGFAAAVAMWTYDLGRSFTGYTPPAGTDQVAELQRETEALRAERDRYSATVTAAESQLNMANSAQKQLAAQVKLLEVENARLKEDLAFFEKLMPVSSSSKGVVIRQIRAELVSPTQIQYQLLVMQDGKTERDFAGNLQFVVTLVQGGKNAMIIFPDGKASDVEKFKLGFKHYQRMEGVLTVPDGALVKAIQARVLEKGQIRAQESAKL